MASAGDSRPHTLYDYVIILRSPKHAAEIIKVLREQSLHVTPRFYKHRLLLGIEGTEEGIRLGGLAAETEVIYSQRHN